MFESLLEGVGDDISYHFSMPERRLWLSVMNTALEDLDGTLSTGREFNDDKGADRNRIKAHQRKIRAINWILSDSDEKASFLWAVCNVFPTNEVSAVIAYFRRRAKSVSRARPKGSS